MLFQDPNVFSWDVLCSFGCALKVGCCVSLALKAFFKRFFSEGQKILLIFFFLNTNYTFLVEFWDKNVYFNIKIYKVLAILVISSTRNRFAHKIRYQ